MELMSHASTFLLPSIPSNAGPSLTYALVVLNQPLPRFTPLLWEHDRMVVSSDRRTWWDPQDKRWRRELVRHGMPRAAQLRICADGGANRLYEQMPVLLPHEDPIHVRHRYKPDVIKGDMDSIRSDVKEFYSKLGTQIEDASYDQDTTDLHKCVAFIQDCTPNLDKSNLIILVSGALGGRFDHEVGNINVIHRFSNVRIVLLSDDCLIQLLPKTHHHEIHIQSSVEGPHCGLIPIGEPSASTTTTGLQWDLTDTAMKFGGLISTSNIVHEEKITVRSDSDLLWTISIRKLK